MLEYGELSIEARLPDYLKSKAKCWKSSPVPGVKFAMATDQYFIEMRKDSSSRTLDLPEEVRPTTNIQVLHSDTDWFYVLTGDECLVLIHGEKFQISQTFENVDFSGIEDYLGIQKPLLFIQPSDGDAILTDGNKNYDTEQEWPPNKHKLEVQQKLSKRMKLTSEHVSKQEEELLSLKSFVDSAARSLAESYNCNNTIKEDRLESVLHNEEKESVESSTESIIQIVDRHIKPCEEIFVIIIEFKSSTSLTDLTIQSVCQESVPVTSTKNIVTFREDSSILYPADTTYLNPDQRGFAIVQVPASLLTLSKYQQICFLMAINSQQGRSRVETVKLTMDLLILNTSDKNSTTSQLYPSAKQESSSNFILQLLTYFSRSVHEDLEVKTDLGNLEDFPNILQHLGFIKSPNRLGFHCWTPGHPLAGTTLMYLMKSPQHLTLKIFSPSYSVMAIIVKQLRSRLPCDTKISSLASA